MSKIAIICAMDKEINYIREHFDARLLDERLDIYFFFSGNHEIVATVCGIGKVNSAISTQRIIDRYAPDYIINVGVAGGLDRSLSVLDMVVGSDTIYHDFYPLSILEEDKNLGASVFRCDERLVALAENACRELLAEGKIKNYVVGRVASGDCFVEDDEKSRYIRESLSASCVEMEGAAIAQTALVNKIPFLVIRSISDFADDDALETEETFVDAASRQAGLTVEKIIKGL